MTERGFNVLFLCTGNSARSILAESILNSMGMGHFHILDYAFDQNRAGAVHWKLLPFSDGPSNYQP